MTKKKRIRSKPPRRPRVSKPVLAMAAPPLEHPVVTIEKLKGGELNYSLRVPGKSLPLAVNRAVAEFQRLTAELEIWQAARRQASTQKVPTARLDAVIERATDRLLAAKDETKEAK